MDDNKYRFEDFNWMANGRGFDKPSNVYLGKTLLGVIVSDLSGDWFYIAQVMTSSGPKNVRTTKHNKFKTQNDAAEMLHVVWQHQGNES